MADAPQNKPTFERGKKLPRKLHLLARKFPLSSQKLDHFLDSNHFMNINPAKCVYGSIQQPCLMLKLGSFLFPLFLLSIGSSATNSTSCRTDRCTNGPEIRYPFWLSHGSSRDQSCGYSEFSLTCVSGYPIFASEIRYYYVKEIDYVNHSIHLVDYDTVNQTCPMAIHGFPFGNLPLSHSPLNLNVSFYYNCSSYPSDVPSISCLRSGVNESFVFLKGNETNGFQWNQNCQEDVTVAMLKDQITSNGLMNQFARAMNEGFVLDWHTTNDCMDCEASGGSCGYNNTAREILCYCEDGSVKSNDCGGRGGSRIHLTKLHIGLIITSGIGVLLICTVLCYLRHKLLLVLNLRQMTKDDQDIEAFIRNHGPLSIKRYTSSDIKKITNSFQVKLGEGGYGVVYKGYLINSCPVAVKVLNVSTGNGEEFINEVVSIGRTSHVNVVKFLGFCLESQKKALVYEYMPNGSLDKFIHNRDSETNPPLSWERLHQIAEGIARGLEYLHRGCNTRILHFDIKPNNILLDKNFCPKIADFGLAKLCSKTNSIISMMDTRGTVGYIAPEVWNRTFGGVSHKSDVYSYGMMILEMAGEKQNMANEVNDTSEVYFPHWIYRHVEVGSNVAWNGASTPEENEIAKKMIIVGLWCIQTIPSHRPSISRVIEMLEGSLEQLEIPPKPYIFSPQNTEMKSSVASEQDLSSSSCI